MFESMKVLKNIILFLLIVCSVHTTFAQSNQSEIAKPQVQKKSRDSYKSSYGSFKEPSNIDVDKQLEKARALKTTDPVQAIKLVQDALIGAKYNEDFEKEADCFYLLGEIHEGTANWNQASVNYKRSSELYLSINNNYQYLNSQLAIVKAEVELSQYLSADERIGNVLGKTTNKSIKANAYELRGEIRYRQKRYEEALKGFNEQLKLEQELQQRNKRGTGLGVSRANANIAKVYAAQNNVNKANSYLKESVEGLENKKIEGRIATSIPPIQEPKADGVISYGIEEEFDEVVSEKHEISSTDKDYDGKFFISDKELSNTIEYEKLNSVQEEVYSNFRSNDRLDEEVNLRKELNAKTIAPDTLVFNSLLATKSRKLAEVQLDVGQLDDAVNSLNEAVILAEKALDFKEQALTFKLLSNALNKQGNQSEALKKFESYVIAQEKVLEQKEKEFEVNREILKGQNVVDLIDNEFALYKKDLDILLEREQVAKAKYQQQKIINYGLLILIVGLIIGAYFIYRNVQEKRKANQMLALKSLRSQMNPHFIFNALNSVNSFISKNDERSANKFLTNFSRLMRMVLDSSNEDLINLEQEIRIIELYLKLEQFRFRDKFDYDLNISEEIDKDNFMIPPMLIQPFIENAVWHGLRYKETYGRLHVQLNKKVEEIEVIIEDNGIGRKRSAELKTQNQKTSSKG